VRGLGVRKLGAVPLRASDAPLALEEDERALADVEDEEPDTRARELVDENAPRSRCARSVLTRTSRTSFSGPYRSV
jgi:hypothetical protein